MKTLKLSTAILWLAMTALIVLSGGCATTSLTSSWDSPDYRGGPIKKLAVFVMVKDEGIRRFAEDQMVQKIPAGTQATAGHTLFDQPVDKERVRAALVKDGYDGVLVSRLVAVDKSQYYVPPQTYFVPTAPYMGVGPYYGNFGGYYGYGYNTMLTTTPGYTVENTTVVVESVLYKLPEDKPIWSATTQSIDPRSRPEMIQAMAQLVEQEMKKKGLIGSMAK